ncbi:MAG TPA: glycoside hydrolase family 75 protein [Candidatus Angelobacter sp.]
MQIDADGAPNAYGPHNRGLDHIANAKHDGEFVGVITGRDGRPVIQKSGPFKGFYVSPTSLHAVGGDETKPSSYVDAKKIPYIVLPPAMTEQFGVTLGDLALVVNQKNGKSSFAIYADAGPADKIGEGSIALAKALGVNADPRHGGIQEEMITYLVFPGSGLGQGKLRTAQDIRRSGSKLFKQWGGAARLKACLGIKLT